MVGGGSLIYLCSCGSNAAAADIQRHQRSTALDVRASGAIVRRDLERHSRRQAHMLAARLLKLGRSAITGGGI